MEKSDIKTIREQVTKEVKEGYRISSRAIASTTREVLGSEITVLVDDIKNMANGGFSILKGAYTWVSSGISSFLSPFKQEEPKKEDKDQTKYLQKISDIFGTKGSGYVHDIYVVNKLTIISDILKRAFRDQIEEQENMSNALESINDATLAQRRKDERQGDIKKSKARFYGILPMLSYVFGAAVGTLAAAIGGVAARFMLPFKVLVNFADSLFSRITRVTNIITRSFDSILNILGRFGTFLRKIFRPFTKITNFVSRVFSTVFGYIRNFVNIFDTIGSRLANISRQASWFLRGFARIAKYIPVVGQVIAIVMGLVDFFRGFVQTEGGIIERIKGGLILALVGFFQPVAWLFEKIAGFFGKDIDAMDGLINIASNLVDSFFSFFSGMVQELRNFVTSAMNLDFKGMITSLGNIVVNWLFKIPIILINAFRSTFSGTFIGPVLDWVLDLFENIKITLKNTIIGIFSPIQSIINNLIDPFKKIWDSVSAEEKNWIGMISGVGEFILKALRGIAQLIINIPWTIIKNLSDFISRSFSGLVGRFSEIHIIGTIITSIQGAFNLITETFNNYIVNPIKSLFGFIGEFMSDGENTIFDKIKSLLSSVFGIPSRIFGWIKSKLPSWEGIKNMFSGEMNIDTKEMMKKSISSIFGLPGKIFGWIGDLIPSWDDIKNMLPGFGDIKDSIAGVAGKTAGAVTDAAKGVADWTTGWFRKDKDDKTSEPYDTKSLDKELSSTGPGVGDELMKFNEKLIDLQEQKDIKLVNEYKNLLSELKKEISELKKEQKDSGDKISNTIISNRQTSSGGGNMTSESESPDEIENFGMVFMNKSTLGASL